MALSLFQQVVEAIREAYHGLRAEGWDDLPILNNIEGKAKHWCVGALEAEAHNSIPRIAWVRTGGKIGGPDRVGPDAPVDDAVLSPLYSASTNVRCFIVGADEGQAERMWFAILNATRTVLKTAANPGDFDFLTQADGKAGHINAAEAIEQLFDWPFIVPNEVRRTVAIQSQHHDDELHSFDGATHTDEVHPDED